jgi:cytidine deaminase
MEKLLKAALDIRENAYVPYSKFHVGAAILLPDDTIQTGINIENRSFGATNCAERTALFSAIEKGYKTFKAIAVATPDADYPVAPCGICRQVLTEFAPGNTPVVFGNTYENRVETTLDELYTYDSLHELGK